MARERHLWTALASLWVDRGRTIRSSIVPDEMEAISGVLRNDLEKLAIILVMEELDFPGGGCDP